MAALNASTVVLGSDWRMQDISKVTQGGEALSKAGVDVGSWYKATVPGTVLTTLVDNKVYPEPLYGENNRPDRIPESLCRSSYWYRNEFKVPADYAGRKIWLNFEGINYTAEVWVNGSKVGVMKGAFARGIFEISKLVSPGAVATLAVLVNPQPNPGISHEHTIALGMGPNGGITALDGPTFLCSLGWDWIPAIRDRNTGIWRKVFLSSTGSVKMKDPLVTTDLPLPKLDSADIGIQVTLENLEDQPRKAVLKGSFEGVSFEHPVEIAAKSSLVVALSPKNVPQLRLAQPKLWWPNGFGPQNLYSLRLTVETEGSVSDEHSLRFGVRKFGYEVPGSENLTISVNGVPVFCKGGNWGMDEAMKRIPRERLEAQIRMHAMANFTMIRNWVGQSTTEDFYDLCDQYGLLLWDEFFQPNPSDGPDPQDMEIYMANVRDKILRFRNHASVAVWCARNEGYPPKHIDDALRKLMAELEPTRMYQPSSTHGKGVESGGPYCWRAPQEYYVAPEPYKTEIGSVSVPTLESVQGMMPQKDWEKINDDWAEHDLAAGAQNGDFYPRILNHRYGKALNLADFVRKAQLANYEAFRALFEGRQSSLFHPSTAALLWMSNPAQPSFVWQVYHHDLEPNAALFASQKACEPVHIQLNEQTGHVQVINNLSTKLDQAKALITVYALDGSKLHEETRAVSAAPSAMTPLGALSWPGQAAGVGIVRLELKNAEGKSLSDNLYWRAPQASQNNLQDLNQLGTMTLEPTLKRTDQSGKCLIEVGLRNPGKQVALMAHLQLRKKKSGQRVLPVYYSDNYLSLAPGESKSIRIEADLALLHGDEPLVVVDGWNVAVTPLSAQGVSIALNDNAQPGHWPVTNIQIDSGPAQSAYRIQRDGKDPLHQPRNHWGNLTYTLPMKPLPQGKGYTVRMDFSEPTHEQPGLRCFNVEIHGKKVLEELDVAKEAGGKNKTLIKEFTGVEPDEEGNIVIHFHRGSADKPLIGGIEIAENGAKP